ncbi:lipopolysaccharide biosynthesis protein [Cryobacterium sp. HLT2-28]|uniref:lipopolysaccharide biosynthesis protein n=1 Tax=Cryobacterium sp. HLT2-28 TaxID=1259146 RepID=UPI00106D036D|nr:oligosaccharide flippase family protein [Cryobacterium sp. HLT2-28]TFB95885.1 hypothetical protein E3O48_05665 [Cryobacterium sp. HLT2-28]
MLDLLRRLGNKDALLVAGMLLASLLPLVLAPVRAQILGPTGRGEFAYFQSAITIIYAVSALGVRHAVYQKREIGAARFLTSKKPVFAVALAASLTSAALLAVLAGEGFNPWIDVIILIIGCFGPIYALTQLEIGNAQLGRYRRRIAITAGGPAVVEFAAGMVLLAIRQFNLGTVVAGTMLAELLRNSAGVFVYVRDRRQMGISNTNGTESGMPLLRASLLAAPAVLVPILASNLDSIIYGAMLGPATLGMYAVAKLGFTLLVLASLTAEGYVVSRWASRRPLQFLVRFVLIGLPIAAFVSTLGFVLFPFFFGSAFEEARRAFPLAVGAGMCGAVFVSCLSIAAFNNRQKPAVVAATFSMAALSLGAIGIGLIGRPGPSEMCLVLMVAQIVGVVLIAFRMAPTLDKG